MSDHTFTPGDEVYLEDGSVASYIAKGGIDGHFVQSIYEQADDEPILGEPRRVRLVFKEAPIPRFDERIADLTAKAATLATQVSERRAELNEIDRKISAQNENLRRHGILELLDDLLAGRITHILTISWNRDELRILPLAEAAKDERSYSSLTALTLKAKPLRPGEVSWAFDRDYGSFQGFRLFRSRDEALAAARDHIAARTGMWIGGKSDVNPVELAKSCKSLGLEVDPKIAETVQRRAIEAAEKRVAEAKNSLAVAQAQLNAVTNDQVPV